MKKLKEMLIGSTVNPDVLTPDKEKEHSMKWKTIWMDVKTPKFSSTNLNLLNEKNNDIVNYVASLVCKHHDEKNAKQLIYRAIISKYGQAQGLNIYNHINRIGGYSHGHSYRMRAHISGVRYHRFRHHGGIQQ